MLGMDINTGLPIGEKEHLTQSIRNIITTPIGSRTMRRNYGCGVFALIDSPMNQLLVAKAQAAIAEALQKYEPRVRFTQVKVHSIGQGHITITIEGYWIESNRFVQISEMTI